MKANKHIVMLGTSFATLGGISAVVNQYRQAGLFERFSIVYLPTHADGSRLIKLRFFIIAWFRFLGLLLQAKVALVHVHCASNASFWRKALFIMPALLFRIPVLLHLHGGGFAEFYERKSKLAGKWLIRSLFDRVAGIVVLSKTWKHWAQSITVNRQIYVISNPVQLQPPTDFSLRERCSILFLGRLGNNKGTYDLLAAVSRIVGLHPNLTLLLGGDGELERVRQEVDKLGIGAHVQVLGWVSGPDKARLLKRAAIYVLPSYREGLPMSVLEAMAAGMPVISTPVGGIPEAITDNLEGCLIPPGDVLALSNALHRLLSDGRLRQNMGLAARKKIERLFCTEHVLPKVERLYHNLAIQS